jgi:purine-nucleoside phosphorylase
MGSGMGMPSMSIYANELINSYGARRLIRIGSCGGMQPHVKLRDLVIAQTASSLSTPSSGMMHGLNFAPAASWALLESAARAAIAAKMPVHIGGIYSSDTFYDERKDHEEILRRHGVLAVEMETAELYMVAARYGAQALAVLTVSDHLQTGESLPAIERERGFAQMVEVALAALD